MVITVPCGFRLLKYRNNLVGKYIMGWLLGIAAMARVILYVFFSKVGGTP